MIESNAADTAPAKVRLRIPFQTSSLLRRSQLPSSTDCRSSSNIIPDTRFSEGSAPKWNESPTTVMTHAQYLVELLYMWRVAADAMKMDFVLLF